MILYAMFTQNIIELFATAYDLQEILQLQFLSQTNQIQIFAWMSVDHHAFQVWRLAGDAQPLVVLEGAELLLGLGLVIEVTKKLAPSVGADLVDGAHQVVEDGYEFFANRKLVTIFSAPNYCGMFENDGCLMSVGEDLTCSFMILKP